MIDVLFSTLLTIHKEKPGFFKQVRVSSNYAVLSREKIAQLTAFIFKNYSFLRQTGISDGVIGKPSTMSVLPKNQLIHQIDIRSVHPQQTGYPRDEL